MNNTVCIENKCVTSVEMNDLLELSKDTSHPYFYKFKYDLDQGLIKADRVRKSALSFSPLRRQYHAIDISTHSSLRRALNLLEEKKRILGRF